MVKKVHILEDKTPQEYLQILGLVSTDTIFKLILDINNFTKYNLKIDEAIQVKGNQPSESFPHGSYYADDYQIHIIKNKVNGQLLFREAKQFDFLVLYKERQESENFSLLKTIIKENIPGIAMISELESKKFRNLKKIISTLY